MISSELQTASPSTGLLHNDFSPEKPYIVDTTLFAYGVTISTVERCRDPYRNLAAGKDAALPLMYYFQDYVNRDAVYNATGIPALQALFRVMTRDASNHMDRVTLLRALGLLSRFCRATIDSVPVDERFTFVTTRQQDHDIVCRDVLGPLLGYDGTDAPDSTLIKCFEESFFPGCDLTQTGIETGPSMLSGLLGTEKNDAIIQADWNFQSSALEGHLLHACQFMETENGLLGLVPKYTDPGDVVCVISGSSLPVVLRPAGGGYKHIGTCWVLGLMNGETAATVKEGDIERFEIR